MQKLKNKLVLLAKKAKQPIILITLSILILYIISLIFWKDSFDWEAASYITVFYGAIGIFFSLWQANAQKSDQKRDQILLEQSLSEEVASSCILQYSIDKIDASSPKMLLVLKESMHLISKVSLFARKDLIDFEELYLICGSDLKGIVLRCVKTISDFDFSVEFYAKGYILKYRDRLVDLYNRIKKLDHDIVLVQDKIDYIIKMNSNHLSV